MHWDCRVFFYPLIAKKSCWQVCIGLVQSYGSLFLAISGGRRPQKKGAVLIRGD